MVKEERLCPKHGTPMKYSPELKQWYCEEELYASYLTAQAQRESAKRYSQTEKFRTSQEKYRSGEKGQKARERYLKSDKYKQRRKEYNERLKESLAIARQAALERPTALKEVEVLRTETFAPLIQDIREYLDIMGHTPKTTEVMSWSKDVYSIRLTETKAAELITQAAKRR